MRKKGTKYRSHHATPRSKRKKVTCLRCDKFFESEDPKVHRICRACTATNQHIASDMVDMTVSGTGRVGGS